MGRNDFWDKKERAQEVVAEVAKIKNLLEPFRKVTSQFEDLQALLELAEAEGDDSPLFAEADTPSVELAQGLENLEFLCFLSGEMDHNNAIVTIRAGAGGTEACDWCNMLFRMYTHWVEQHGFSCNIEDIQPGDEAGLKSVVFMVNGEFAYGHLKAEKGVHRLVRISPFDANKRRHTSFASVDVLPEINDDIQVDINEADLKIDTFRASGAGGQHINRTDSAVRVTHLPTGIVVVCQSERSQHKNKAHCMSILKAKLYDLEDQKRRANVAAEAAAKGDNAFGNQIRSYVLQPYQLVKDLRTSEETSNVQAVLDGDIDRFIIAWLKAGQPTSRISGNDEG